MQSLCWEWITVVLANNAGLAVKQQQRVAVNEQPVAQFEVVGLLQHVLANVA
jgi:hypothetical protein